MKKAKTILTIGVVAVTMAVGASFLRDSAVTTTAATDTAAQSTNTIQVNGNGNIKVAPDIAYVNVGAQITETDAKAAQANASKIMNEVVAALKALGVDEKDIQTTNVSVYPKSTYDNQTYQETIVGYTATNSMKVTVRDIEKVGEVLDKAAEAGANYNNGINFSLADQSKYYNEALKQAISSAEGKAKVVAASIGVSIGKPANVTETSSSYESPIYYGNAKMAVAEFDSAAGVAVSVGEIEVSASVTMTFGY